MKKTTETTLTVATDKLRDGQFLDIHHEVMLDVDAPGLDIWTFSNDSDDAELVWCDMNDVVDNLLSYEDFEDEIIDDWIGTLGMQITKMKAYKAYKALRAENDTSV